jgi:glycosyltransferase involved in cell wall biosynthesis
MKILIVSYSYRPSLTPRAFRWSAIAEQWAAQGHQVDVLCETVAGRGDEERLESVRVYRCGSGLVNTVRAKAGGAGAPAGRKPGLLARAKQMLRKAWRKLYWPDYACLWYPKAASRALALQAANRYDVMYSSSIPFTGHLVALAVKKAHPGLRWVVDVGDPFCFADAESVNNFSLYAGLNVRAERKVFSAASAISVTTHGTMERYAAIFPKEAQKISVIPPLLPQFAQPAAGSTPIFAQDGKIRIVFVGTLYKAIRSPDILLQFFSRLLATDLGPRLELHFFGDLSACRENFDPYAALLGEKIFIHGLVDKKTAVEATREAGLLVNIGNNTMYQLPSKVVEYLAMSKPIINFVSTPQDSSLAFFAADEGVISTLGDEAVRDPARFDELADFIRHARPVDPQKRALRLESFATANVAQAYLALGS